MENTTNIIKLTIPIGIGDLIYLKAMLDNSKHRFSEIHIRFRRDIIDRYNLDKNYNQFLDEMGNLFFSEPPYIITNEESTFYELPVVCGHYHIPPVKPNLKHLLCRGNQVNIDGEYIAIVTKTRYMPHERFEEIKDRFFDTLNQLSNKYKIVVLGEREVQMNAGYVHFKNSIYSLYPSIIQNIPSNRIIDMTLPALGITAPSLKQIQQDCMVLNQAKFVITIGVGGGMCIASAVSNVIGYRVDEDVIADEVFKQEYPDALITKDFEYFLSKLRGHL